MKLFTVLVGVAAIAGLASTADAHPVATFSAWEGFPSARTELRHILVGDHQLDAGISLPSSVVRSNSGSSAFLCFTPTGGDGADKVASYDIKTGGWSFDQMRQSPASHVRGGCSAQFDG